jgi:hydrogenase-4 component F
VVPAAFEGSLILALPAAAIGFTAAVPGRYAPRAAHGLGAALLLAALLAVVRANAPYFGLDALSRWFLPPVLAFSGLGLFAATGHVAAERAAAEPPGPAWSKRHLLLYMAFVAAIVGVVTLPNLLLVWVAVESTTLTSVFLVAYERTPTALEAAWKYLIVTGVGGMIALLGISLTLVEAGMPLQAAQLTPPAAPAGSREGMLLGLVLAVVGLGTKAGLAPMHAWLPDTHAEAPAPVSALLSGVELSTALYALLRVLRVISAAIGPLWPQRALILLGLFSLAVAAGLLALQRDLKRLLAYSSVEHMGLVAFGLGLGGLAAVGALLHVWTHGASKTLAFFAAGEARERYGTARWPALRGVVGAMPVVGTMLAVGLVGVVGLPPFGVFFSEWLIFTGGLGQPGRAPLVLAALGLVALAFVGVAGRAPRMLAGAAPRSALGPESLTRQWPLLLLCAISAVVGILAPAWLNPVLAGAARAVM